MAEVVSSCCSDGNDNEGRERGEFLAGHIDTMIRHAVTGCWAGLPKERRNTEEHRKQLQRLLDRALEDFQADRKEFSRTE